MPARRRGGTGRLRFELDDRRRWSLWYVGGGQPVPLIQNATLGAWIADQFLTLSDLDNTSVGSRRPPGGDAVVMRGRAGGVLLEAEFLAGPPAAVPVATVSLSIYPDRDLSSIKGVRFVETPGPELMPGAGALVVLVSGAHSGAGVRLMALPSSDDSKAVISDAVLGLTRETQGLGFAFDPEDPGRGNVSITAGALVAQSNWVPARPVRPGGDTSRLRLCYDPDGDGVDALRALFVPASQVDRERLAAAPAPTGWSSGRERRATLTEQDITRQADFCAAHFDRRFLRVIELGDGYQRSLGDWDANERFSHGHRSLTDQIHERRFQAGLWLAPFGVSERSGIPAAHPDWLVRNLEDEAPMVLETEDSWGGRIYALDGAHPAARQWLLDLARRVVREWGYDYLRLDHLHWAAVDGSHFGGLTPAEACRLGLGALRDGAGSDVFLLGGNAPLQPSIGFVNGMRITPHTDGGWSGIRTRAHAAALRSFYHRGVWLNDPDALAVGPPLSLAEAQVWTSIVAVAGDITILSDDLAGLDADRLVVIDRALPATTTPGRPIGAARSTPDGVPPADERPAPIWITEGAPRWWTVVLVNWDDDAKHQSVPLPELGLAGARFTAYDVWRGTPLPDLTNVLTATLDPHSCLTVGIRAAAARPQVVGTTRHVVQGAVDIADETWDAATRTLRARAINVDRRAYGVTVAVPSGMRLGTCKADVPCTVRRLESGHAVLEWAAGASPSGTDVAWEITFRKAAAAGKD